MNDSNREPRGEKGLYLILVAFFLFVLVALCALVVGLGFLSTNKTRLQNIANVSSIGALDSFVQARDSSGNLLPYDQRRTAALTRANELIVANKKLPGVRMDLGDVGLPPAGGNGGTMTLGIWYPEMPSSGTPCGPAAADYPCFVENPVSPPGTPYANAVKLELKSQPNNPLIAPLTGFLGSNNLGLQTSTIARVVQRCVAFLLDISMSTVQETHVNTNYKTAQIKCRPPGAPWNGSCGPAAQNTLAPTPALAALTPYPMGLFAYRMQALTPIASLTPPPVPTPHPCENLNNYQNDEFFYYCNMPINRNGAVPAAGTPWTQHFRSDYRLAGAAPYGTVFVDKLHASINTYYGPQPLSRFFLAFNAGLRAVNAIRSPGDKALVYAFAGQAIGTEPMGTPPYGVSENLDLMIQLTDVYNRGTINSVGNVVHPVITPNFVTRGWFPILTDPSDPNYVIYASTNHAQAIWEAIGALSNCPDTARRSIIIASDGIPSCGWNRQGSLAGTPRPDPTTDCAILAATPGGAADGYGNYMEAERAILGPIKDELVKRGITVTTLLDADTIDPNFLNFTAAPGTPTPPSVFINPEDAPKYGFCGIAPTPGSCPQFFDNTSEVPSGAQGAYSNWLSHCASGDFCDIDHFAFLAKDAPQYGVKFRRPNGLWGQLAFDTGGVVCPLLPTCAPGQYTVATPPALNPTARASMSKISCSPVKLDKSQQAINCVLAAIGVDPYQNVEELPTATPSN